MSKVLEPLALAYFSGMPSSIDYDYLIALARPAFFDCGNLATRANLNAAGLTQRGIERLIATGDVVRVFHGGYVPRGLDGDQLHAARLGARLTGPSLFARLGAWEPNGDRRLHISVPRSADRPRVGPAVRVHWSPVSGVMLSEPLESAVGHVVAGLARDECVAVLDSVIRRRIMSRAQVAAALRGCASRGGNAVLSQVDPSAESGAETLLRLWLRRRGVSFRPQTKIGRFRVDFLLGTRLVVEVVGEKYHASTAAFEADCEREAYLQGLGYQVLRISARQVYNSDERALSALSTMIRRHQHVYGVRPVEANRGNAAGLSDYPL